MKRPWKIGIVVSSTLVGLGLILLIGYYAKRYLVDIPKELSEHAEKVDVTYIKREMPLADLIQMPTVEGNAAQDYIKALKFGYGDREIQLRGEGRVAIYDTEAKILDYILAGAQKTDCDFATMEYQTAEGIINFPTPTFSLNPIVRRPSFVSAMRCARALAAKGDRYFILGEVQKALRVYESILVFGHHLESCRQTIVQFMAGVGVSAIGTDRLEKFYSYQGNTKMAAKVKEYKAQSEEMKSKFSRKKSEVEPLMMFPLGNYKAWIRILKEDEDAMFRREAARSLLAAFAPVQLHQLFGKKKASKALEDAMQNDDDQSVRETARNVLNFVKNKQEREASSTETPQIDLSKVLEKRAEEGTAQKNDFQTWLDKGSGYYHKRRFNEAIDAYKEAISLQPDHAEAHSALGAIYHAKWKRDGPETRENARPTRPDRKTEENLEPNQRAQNNLPPFARRILEERGISIEELRNSPELQQELRKGFRSRVDEVPQRKRVRKRVRRGVPGDQDSVEPIQRDQSNPELRERSRQKVEANREGAAMIKPMNHTMGLLDKARNEYELALELDPGGVYTFAVHNGLGKLCISEKIYGEAIAEFRKSIALKPEYTITHVYLAEAYSAKGLYNEAIAELELAAYISPKAPDIYYSLARLYSLKNDKSQAIEALGKAVGLAGYSGKKYMQKAKNDDDFDNIRSTPEFQTMLSEHTSPDYRKAKGR